MVVVVLLLSALTAGGLSWLESVADRVDSLPRYRYSQPLWSPDESSLAYFRTTFEPDSKRRVRELWWTKRVGDEPAQKLAECPLEPRQLLGWMGDQEAILVSQPGPDSTPNLRLHRLDGKPATDLEFQRPNLSWHGLQGERLYFCQLHYDIPFEPPAINQPDSESLENYQEVEREQERTLTRQGLEVLSWGLDENGFRKHLTIPFSPRRALTMESIVPSPDGRFLALGLRLGEDVGIWVYDSKNEKLRWSSIQAAARHCTIVWSPDSVGLLASLDENFFLLPNVMTTAFQRFTTETARGFRLVWGRDDELTLQNGQVIFRLDPDNFEAERLLDERLLSREFEQLELSPRGSWAAYIVDTPEQESLFSVSLSTLQSRSLLPPSPRQKARQTLLYQVADGTRFARRNWLGGGGRSTAE